MPDSTELVYARHVEHRCQQTGALLAECGYDRLLIHSGHAHARFQDDQHPPFRAHPHFVSWLPLPFTPDCLLEVRAGGRPRLWYCQPDDFWHLPPDDPESWWADRFEIEVVRTPDDWRGVLAQDGASAGATAIIGDPVDFPDADSAGDLNPDRLVAGLNELRTVKSAWEREQIARANRIAVAGHEAAAAAFRAGAGELDIHLEYLKASGQDPDRLPYNSIVGLNTHAAILHYQVRDPLPPRASRSFLIDAGALSHGYASDVTRTWAADGEDQFAELIAAVDQLQLRLCARVRPGQSYTNLHGKAHLGLAAILEQAGLVRMTPEAMVEAGVTRHFLPHGLGHFIGAQVHDVAGRVSPEGAPLPPPEADPALRLTRDLAPGNVLTIEPGLYFIPALLERLKNGGLAERIDWQAVDRLVPLGGVRVEDNVLVTEAEPVNYTREAQRLVGAE